MKGELFDIQSPTAFGIHLGARLLTSNEIPAEKAEGFLGTKNPHRLERYVMPFIFPVSEARLIVSFLSTITNFSNHERLSDIVVTYSNQRIWAHKIVLATHSSYFQELLKGSPTVSHPIAHPCGATELT
jgi:hypothetical protein